VQTAQLRHSREQEKIAEETRETQALQVVQQAYLAQRDQVV
jgi:hypothetical protein